MHLKFLILTSVRQKNRYLEFEMLDSGGIKCPLKSFSKQFCPCPKKVDHPWVRLLRFSKIWKIFLILSGQRESYNINRQIVNKSQICYQFKDWPISQFHPITITRNHIKWLLLAKTRLAKSLRLFFLTILYF